MLAFTWDVDPLLVHFPAAWAQLPVDGIRYYDFDDDPKYFEIKTGVANFRSIARQLAYDVEAKSLDEQDITWVFVASKHTGIGPDPRALNLLEEAGIPIQVYWP